MSHTNLAAMSAIPTESRFKMDEKVSLNFFKSGIIKDCIVSGIHFGYMKVRYDILVPIIEPDEITPNRDFAELMMVDSVFVTENQ
jgi:hypothetical protein